MKNYLYILVLLYIFGVNASTEHLDIVSDASFPSLVKEEKYILVLFNKDGLCSGECAELEEQLLDIREDLVSDTQAWVIRSNASFWNLKDNSLVFVREGLPLLYTQKHSNTEELLEYFLDNRKSKAKQLSDESFEHDTQATTGATTGDWLLVFLREECGSPCDYSLPHIEAAAAEMHTKLSVAYLNRDADAALTTRRLGVTTFPSVILIRQGFLYRMNQGDIYSSKSIQDFALGDFSKVAKETIPPAKSQLADMRQACVDYARENPWTLFGSIFGVLSFIGLVVLLNRPPPKRLLKKSKRH